MPTKQTKRTSGSGARKRRVTDKHGNESIPVGFNCPVLLHEWMTRKIAENRSSGVGPPSIQQMMTRALVELKKRGTV